MKERSSSIEQEIIRLFEAEDGKSKKSVLGMGRFSKSSKNSLNALGRGKSLSTKDLIGFLLGHGSRAERMAAPKTHIQIRAFTPSGNPAVKIRV